MIVVIDDALFATDHHVDLITVFGLGLTEQHRIQSAPMIQSIFNRM